MYDELIKELFPGQRSVLAENSSLDKQVLYVADEFSHWTSGKMGLNTLQGRFDLTNTWIHYASNYFPSAFCRKYLLYLQMLCSATFSASHFTIRQDLPSYLIAHTFFGKGILKYEGQEYTLLPGDLFFIDCRKKHEYHAADPRGWGYRFLHFDGNAASGYYSRVSAGKNVKYSFGKDSRMTELWKRLITVNYESDPNSEILSNLIITEMITCILCQIPESQKENIPDLVMKVCSYIDDHFTEKITLDEISAACCISKYYMSRMFRKYLGQTVYGYVTDCRIIRARKLLRYSELSVNSISEAVGFEDHNGFYRAFTAREGMSPSAYRKYWSAYL